MGHKTFKTVVDDCPTSDRNVPAITCSLCVYFTPVVGDVFDCSYVLKCDTCDNTKEHPDDSLDISTVHDHERCEKCGPSFDQWKIKPPFRENGSE